MLLGISAASNKNIEKVLQSVDKADESKINTLYNIVKILSENINEL